MRVDVLVKPDGRLWFLYDKPLKHVICWVEYDQEAKSITFITEEGISQNLGMKATSIMDTCLIRSTNATLAYVENGDIVSAEKVAITIRKK